MAKPLTLEALGHVNKDGQFWLSDTYANARTDYKVIEDSVIGYYIAGDGHRSPVRVAPIYRATIWQRVGKRRHIASSYEVGAYFNPYDACANTGFYGEDNLANNIANTVRVSIQALEWRAQERESRQRASKKTSKKTRKKAKGSRG